MITHTDSLFLTDYERRNLNTRERVPMDARWMIRRRAEKQAITPGLVQQDSSVDWWHCSFEHIVDACMSHALKADKQIGSWIRTVVMAIVRRPDREWAGPAFRPLGPGPQMGHLETAHISWACSMALDLCSDVFSEDEQNEVRTILRDRAVPMCRRWIDRHNHLNNWRCVLLAGMAVPAAVLGDREALEYCADEWCTCIEAFEHDGSYGEGLQYSNYAIIGLMLTWEALHRFDPTLADKLPIERYGRCIRWHVGSLLYKKPFGGEWGGHPRARSLNFNDSAAIFVASPEVLLHIASRCKDTLPAEAAVARWIFEEYWCPISDFRTNERVGVGRLSGWSLPFIGHLSDLPPARSPQDVGLNRIQQFDCGDTIIRDAWGGSTVLGIRGGGQLYCHGHLHADLGHFILTHGNERMLVDPGHSCYRGSVHALEGTSAHHNTCTFILDEPEDTIEWEPPKYRKLEQNVEIPRRRLGPDGRPGALVDRGAKRLITKDTGAFSLFGQEVSAAYPDEIEHFARYYLMIGSHTLFVVDNIRASEPVRTCWNWILNNRDNELDLKTFGDRFVARRGSAGMKLVHLGEGTMNMGHGWVHAAYHPKPNSLGEGPSGSATILRFQEDTALKERWTVHAINLDSIGMIAGWHLLDDQTADAVIESPHRDERWALSIDRQSGLVVLEERIGGNSWSLGTVGQHALREG